MATRKKAKAEETEQTETTQASSEDVLTKTAKAIGSAIGTVAAKTGIVHQDPAPAQSKPKSSGKLVAKNKKRLPRKEKKRLKKQGALQAS